MEILVDRKHLVQLASTSNLPCRLYTCELADANAFDYLNQLQIHATDVSLSGHELCERGITAASYLVKQGQRTLTLIKQPVVSIFNGYYSRWQSADQRLSPSDQRGLSQL